MGKELLNTLLQATGLPNELIEKELKNLLDSEGLKEEDVTLDDLRVVLAKYLQDVLIEAKQTY